MSILSQIEQIFNDSEAQQERKNYEQVLSELKEIKAMLRMVLMSEVVQTKKASSIDHDKYIKFVNDFRRKMQPDTILGIYPEFHYGKQRLGIDFRGYIYNKDSSETLSALEAKKIYRWLYENKMSENVA